MLPDIGLWSRRPPRNGKCRNERGTHGSEELIGAVRIRTREDRED
jgi:hypothetical protein